jgi:capsular exopolysaccharide synthesis family protein
VIARTSKEAPVDAIQTYKGQAAPPSLARSAALPLAVNPAALKTTSNYLRALRRRIWAVLAIAVPVAIGASIYVLRLPPVYLVKAEIEIDPPEYDPMLSTLVSHDLGRHDSASQERYIPNRAAQLRTKWLREKVVNDPRIVPELSQYLDPAEELFRTLNVIQVQKGGNSFLVTLEGRDAGRTTKLLQMLLDEFQKYAKDENERRIWATASNAGDNLRQLKDDLAKLDLSIDSMLKNTRTIGPGGRSIIEDEYVSLSTILGQKQLRLGELHQQMMAAQMMPRFDYSGEAGARKARISALSVEARKDRRVLEHIHKVSRRFNSDPAAKEWSARLDEVLDELEELRSIRTEMPASATEMIMEEYQREIEADREQHQRLLSQMQESLPGHQRFLTALEERRELARRIADMAGKLTDFDILSKSQAATHFVKIPSKVPEPTVPIKPNRPLLIAFSVIMSFAMGIALVCLLEHVDHSVKVPEHVSHGLTLPLLGVVPRIRRTALTQKGRHLWTPGTNDSIAADAYRNVRASLLGVADRRGPIITLLVTSAKAGEGKSTTALNLAATCALAGERTLLVDVDLRRPSLGYVFVDDPDAASAPGVVDVLRGEIPWQRTLRHSQIPNLDFIPTGDTRDTPIEVLGTLELRQFLLALSHHYDRVILDGPAVLGLADCRFLGRLVDASLLVVRAGSHHLTTLHRAKAMLEQSHVNLAGVVFNGLTEDINNWSSYGYDESLSPSGRLPGAPAAPPGGLAIAHPA